MCVTTEQMLEALALAGVPTPSPATPAIQIEKLYNQLQASAKANKSNNDVPVAGSSTLSSKPVDAKDTSEPGTSAEISLSQMQKQIKEMQDKVATLEAAVAKKSYVDHIESMVQPFSGDDFCAVQKWLADLENAFQVLGMTDKQKIVATTCLLTGTAAVFLRTVRVNEYEDLKTKLLNEFGSEFTLGEIHAHLRKRRLQPKETVRRYVLEMVEMAQSSAIPEDELVDIIIDGLGDSSNHVALLYGARTVDELKTMLDRYERKRFGGSRRISKGPKDVNDIVFEITMPSISKDKSLEVANKPLATFSQPDNGNADKKVTTNSEGKPVNPFGCFGLQSGSGAATFGQNGFERSKRAT